MFVFDISILIIIQIHFLIKCNHIQSSISNTYRSGGELDNGDTAIRPIIASKAGTPPISQASPMLAAVIVTKLDLAAVAPCGLLLALTVNDWPVVYHLPSALLPGVDAAVLATPVLVTDAP